ncbi:hypothetical protein I79_025903 [Cricetulus griseus]|uniref:Uncharacterized protein n=1 Tax=Cricetulus griseus TaxID=10029 RepID=G3IPJ2_CRIGR|nr:hypothetical protein I79_025903 [Cricetulus griseus]
MQRGSICVHEVHSHGIQSCESGQNKSHSHSTTCWWYMMDEANASPYAVSLFLKALPNLEKIIKESIK